MSYATSLISRWRLDETSGNAADSHGSNALTAVNTPGSTTGKVGDARVFNSASTRYFSVASNSTLQVGDIDFTIAGWFQLTTKTTYRMLVAKDDAASSREYTLYYDAGADRFAFVVFSGGTGATAKQVNADNLGSPSTATWYYVVAWHDSTGNVVGIQVNNGTPNTTAHTTGVFTGTAAFQIGRYATAFPHDGYADDVSLWKRLLTTDEKTALYNSGSGFDYPMMSGAAAVTIGAATASASATFTGLTYSATVAVTTGEVVSESIASHGDPPAPNQGEAFVDTGAATASASATFAAPIFYGESMVDTGAATASASATFTAPIYSATAAVTIAPVEGNAEATFEPGTKTATVAVTTGETEGRADAQFEPGTKTATADVTTGAAVSESSATFAPGTKTATASVTTGATVAAAEATFTAPVYSATAAVSVGAVDGDATAIFATVVYSATAAVTTSPATAAAEATHEPPAFTGSAAVSTGAALAAAVATFAAPVYTGAVTVTLGAAVADATATFLASAVAGTIAVSIGPVTMAGTATGPGSAGTWFVPFTSGLGMC